MLQEVDTPSVTSDITATYNQFYFGRDNSIGKGLRRLNNSKR